MRVTASVARKSKKNRLFRKLKGHNQIFQASYTMGKTLLVKKSTHQFRSRKLKKRDHRSLFIQRIGAAVRQLFDISYSKFIHIMNNSAHVISRKVLAHLCYTDMDAFKQCVNVIMNSK